LHGQLTIIAAEELRLTPAEAEGIAGLHTEHCLIATEVRSLNEQVQGWAAGLNLLLRRSHPTRPPPPLATVELIFDYFAVEVWNQLDLALQTFLLKTALLPKMTDRPVTEDDHRHGQATDW